MKTIIFLISLISINKIHAALPDTRANDLAVQKEIQENLPSLQGCLVKAAQRISPQWLEKQTKADPRIQQAVGKYLIELKNCVSSVENPKFTKAMENFCESYSRQSPLEDEFNKICKARVENQKRLDELAHKNSTEKNNTEKRSQEPPKPATESVAVPHTLMDQNNLREQLRAITPNFMEVRSCAHSFAEKLDFVTLGELFTAYEKLRATHAQEAVKGLRKIRSILDHAAKCAQNSRHQNFTKALQEKCEVVQFGGVLQQQISKICTNGTNTASRIQKTSEYKSHLDQLKRILPSFLDAKLCSRKFVEKFDVEILNQELIYFEEILRIDPENKIAAQGERKIKAVLEQALKCLSHSNHPKFKSAISPKLCHVDSGTLSPQIATMVVGGCELSKTGAMQQANKHTDAVDTDLSGKIKAFMPTKMDFALCSRKVPPKFDADFWMHYSHAPKDHPAYQVIIEYGEQFLKCLTPKNPKFTQATLDRFSCEETRGNGLPDDTTGFSKTACARAKESIEAYQRMQ